MEWKTITISYLELRPEKALEKGNTEILDGLRLEQLTLPSPLFNCFMYRAVGGKWFWTDKLHWSEREWYDYVYRDALTTWGAWLHGAPCGYFELEQRGADRIEIAYLGILEQFSGQGLGKQLLRHALECARTQNPQQRITVNTCSLDHPASLANYLARGLTVYREESIRKCFPIQPPSFWTR
jgi:GNAT superfamily N-acetyltransferase